MRKAIVSTLLFLAAADVYGQSVPAGWKTIKDSKSLCQIAVPENWTAGAEGTGSAFQQDATVAIAVVTSQPGQTFKPISEFMLKQLNVPKEKVFENSAKRTFYQDRAGRDANEQSAFSAMIPGRNGTCSARVAFLPSVPEETARKIMLSLAPAPEVTAGLDASRRKSAFGDRTNP